ncbi:hypothetical protein Tco_0990762, partial [Tanacetum coccineum]
LKKRGRNRPSSSTSTLPQAFEIGESSHKTSLEPHEEQIKEILNHLDELSLDRIEHIEDKIEESRTQIAKLQRKQLENNSKISLARFRITNLEQIIEDIQSGGGVVDLTGDEDPTDEDGDIGVSVSLGDEIFLEGKKSQESNIGDSDNTGDGGKTAGRAIITWGGGIASLISESEGTILSFECVAPLCLSVVAVGCAIGIIETQAIDDQDPLVNYDNDNENDDLGYQSEEYFDEVQEDDENNHSNRNVGYFDVDLTVRKLVKSTTTKMACSKSVYQHTMGRGRYALVKEKMVSPVDINPINSSADEEGGTTLVVFENDVSIQKSNGLATLEKEMETRVSNKTSPCETVKSVGSKKMTRSTRKDSSCQDSQSQENVSSLLVLPQTDGKQMLYNKELPKDCYKVSIDTSLVDAACIPDVGNNGFKTVKDAVGGFFAWPKDQVVFDPKATPPSTIQMNVENKTAPKLQTKRKNVYVSSDAMQRQAKKKSLHKFGINKWYQSFALRNFDLEDMELESTNSGPTTKLPILKLGEYEMWVIRIKQYFQIQYYALWEVIENGDSWVSVPQKTQENGTSVTKMSIPVTIEEKTNKKNDVTVGLLLMALPNEHQLTFS